MLSQCSDKLAFCTCSETTNTTVSQDVLPLTVATVSKRMNNNVSNYFSHEMPIVCWYVCIKSTWESQIPKLEIVKVEFFFLFWVDHLVDLS